MCHIDRCVVRGVTILQHSALVGREARFRDLCLCEPVGKRVATGSANGVALGEGRRVIYSVAKES
jgi:hypothetical protein